MPSNSFAAAPGRGRRVPGIRLLALGFSLFHLAGHAQPALSLDRALQLAQDHSQQLVAQDAAAMAAREMAIAAGQLPDPTLKLSLTNVPADGPDRFSLTRDFMTMRSVGVMQEFTRSDKRAARAARFERTAQVAQAGRVMALAKLQRETALAWLDRFYQERMRDVLRTQRAEAGLQIEAADAAYRGGRGSQADLFAPPSQVAQIDDRIQQADRRVANARIRLARWVGDDAAGTLDTPPSLDVVRFDPTRLEDHVADHPEIAWMSEQEGVARAEVEVARSDKRADWSVEVMYSQRGPAYSNMFSVNFSVPLQWDQKNRQDRQLAAKLAQAEQLRAEREEVTREHLATTRQWWQEWQSKRARLAHYDSALVPLAAERTHAAITAYRGATGTLTSALEARRMEIDTRIDRLALAMGTAALWAQLQYLIPAETSAMHLGHQP